MAGKPDFERMSERLETDGLYLLLIGTDVGVYAATGWAQHLSQLSGEEVDWHFYCGRYAFKYIGDRSEVERAVRVTIGSLWSDSNSPRWCWLTDDGTIDNARPQNERYGEVTPQSFR